MVHISLRSSIGSKQSICDSQNIDPTQPRTGCVFASQAHIQPMLSSVANTVCGKCLYSQRQMPSLAQVVNGLLAKALATLDCPFKQQGGVLGTREGL